jgi:phage/plasmid-associated DNA primase
MTEIPEQLDRAGYRFLKVARRQKRATEDGWPDTANYAADDTEILDHLKNGGNYAAMAVPPASILDLDVFFPAISEKLPRTTTVKTGKVSGQGRHFYLIVTGGKIKNGKLYDESGNPIGEIKAWHSYCVGPGSIHPSGNTYEVTDASEVAEITATDLEAIIGEYRQKKREMPPETIAPRGSNKSKKSIFDLIRSKLDDQIMMPVENVSKTGHEVRGCHPAHGCGDNRDNYSYNESTGEWKCFTHDSGGHKIDMYAVKSDIVQCQDAGTGSLRGETGQKVIEQARKDGLITEEEEVKLLPAYLRREKITIKDKETKEIKEIILTHIDTMKYAAFLSEEFSLQNYNKVLYLYDEEKHHYHSVANELETHHHDVMETYYVIGRGQTKKMWSEISHLVRSMGCHTEFPFNHSGNSFPVLNGILQIDPETYEVTLLPHGKEHLFTFVLPVKYDEKADRETVLKIFRQLVSEKDVYELLRIPARALYQSMRQSQLKRANLCVGPKDSGKTTLMDILHAFFGREPRANISLQKLCGHQFALGSLIGKIINIHDDMEDIPVKQVGQFKQITGGTEQEIEKKYEQPTEAPIYATNIFTCNRPPRVDIKAKLDDAWWSRWWIIVFPNHFTRDDNWFKRTVTPEFLSGMLLLVVGELIKIMQTGTVPQNDWEETEKRWEIEADPLKKWIDHRLRYTGKLAILDKEGTLEDYRNFAKKENFPEDMIIRTIELFSRRVREYGFEPWRAERIDPDTKKKDERETYRAPYESRYPELRRVWVKGKEGEEGEEGEEKTVYVDPLLLAEFNFKDGTMQTTVS